MGHICLNNNRKFSVSVSPTPTGLTEIEPQQIGTANYTLVALAGTELSEMVGAQSALAARQSIGYCPDEVTVEFTTEKGSAHKLSHLMSPDALLAILILLSTSSAEVEQYNQMAQFAPNPAQWSDKLRARHRRLHLAANIWAYFLSSSGELVNSTLTDNAGLAKGLRTFVLSGNLYDFTQAQTFMLGVSHEQTREQWQNQTGTAASPWEAGRIPSM